MYRIKVCQNLFWLFDLFSMLLMLRLHLFCSRPSWIHPVRSTSFFISRFFINFTILFGPKCVLDNAVTYLGLCLAVLPALWGDWHLPTRSSRHSAFRIVVLCFRGDLLSYLCGDLRLLYLLCCIIPCPDLIQLFRVYRLEHLVHVSAQCVTHLLLGFMFESVLLLLW